MCSLAIFAMGYVVSPCVALWRVADALQTGDVATLEQSVDWAALRNGMKQDMADGIIGPVSTQFSANSLPPFGASFITGIAGNIIDREMTASNLVAMVHQDHGDDAMANPINMIEHAFFKSPTVFQVVLRDQDDEGHLRLQLELQGTHWRVTRAWIPQDLIERVAQRT
jgi:hypothetical protein